MFVYLKSVKILLFTCFASKITKYQSSVQAQAKDIFRPFTSTTSNKQINSIMHLLQKGKKGKRKKLVNLKSWII